MSGAWPECAHPRCDGKAGDPAWDVCEPHKPAPLDTPAKLAALAADCELAKHSNGWRISHWTGAYLPVPLVFYHPGFGDDTGRDVLGDMVNRAQFAPKWAAQQALAMYRRGETPEAVGQINGDGTVGEVQHLDQEQPRLLSDDMEGAA